MANISLDTNSKDLTYTYTFTGSHKGSLVVSPKNRGFIFTKNGESGLIYNRTYFSSINGYTASSNAAQPGSPYRIIFSAFEIPSNTIAVPNDVSIYSYLTPYSSSVIRSSVSGSLISTNKTKEYSGTIFLAGNNILGVAGTLSIGVHGKWYDREFLKNIKSVQFGTSTATITFTGSQNFKGVYSTNLNAKNISSNKVEVPLGEEIYPISQPESETLTDSNQAVVRVKSDFFNDSITFIKSSVDVKDLKLVNGILSWSPSNSDYKGSYEILINDSPYRTTTSTSLTLPESKYKGDVFKFEVKPKTTYTFNNFSQATNIQGVSEPNKTDNFYIDVKYSYQQIIPGSSSIIYSSILYPPVITYERPTLNSVKLILTNNNKVSPDARYIINDGVLKTTSNSYILLENLDLTTKYKVDISYHHQKTVDGVLRVLDSDYVSTEFTLNKLEKPTISIISTDKPDKFKVQISDVPLADHYEYDINNSDIWSSISNNDEIEVDAPNDYLIHVKAVYEDDESYNSDPSEASFTALRLSSPELITTVDDLRTGVDSATLLWNSVKSATSYSYSIDDIVSTTNNLNATISSITPGLHLFRITSVYSNTSFNSLPTSISGTWSKLEKPVLNKSDNESDTSTETPYITLTWSSIPYGGSGVESKGVFYRLKHIFDYYDVTAGEEKQTIQILDSRIGLSEIIYGDITNNNDIGTHTWSVEAYYTENEQYNSGESNTIQYDISIIKNPSNINFRFDTTTYSSYTRAYLTWNQFTNADRYRIYTPDAPQGKKEITTQNNYYPYYSNNIITAGEYLIKLTAYNTNHYYYRESSQTDAATLTYKVIKLSTPTNLKWSISTTTLTWNSVPNATKYSIYLYDGAKESLLTTTPSTSYTNDFGIGSYTLHVYAEHETLVNGVDINSQLTPKYLRSNSAEIYIGYVLPPKNLGITYSSSSAKIYWDHVVNDAGIKTSDGYKLILYKNGVKNKEITIINNSYSFNHDLTPSGAEYKFTIQNFQDIDGRRVYSEETTISSWNFTVRSLSNTTITFQSGKSIFSWSLVSYATKYEIYINNALEDSKNAPTSINLYNYSSISKTSPGEYNLAIKCRGSNDFLFLPSTTKSDTIYKVIKLNDAVVSYSTSTSLLSWTNPNSGSGYKYQIKINGRYKEDGVYKTYSGSYVSETSPFNIGTLNLPAGSYTAAVIIKRSTSSNNDDNPHYLDSTESKISFGVLAAPDAYLEENVVKWDSIEGADYYEVYDGDSLIFTTNELSYTLISSIPKIFNIKIWARSYSSTIDSSNSYSETLLYQFYKLETPQISFSGRGVISWVKVLNADYYDIYISGSYFSTTTLDYIDISESGYTGEVSINIKARSNKINYLDSNSSSPLAYYNRLKTKYAAIIDGRGYEVEAPSINILLTKDLTMDSATITLRPNRISERFEKRTLIHIAVYTSDYNYEEQREELIGWDFRIAEDDVTEIKAGKSILYEHKLILVDLTKDLQYEYLPDFTITQPLSVVQAELISNSELKADGEFITTPITDKKINYVSEKFINSITGSFDAELLESKTYPGGSYTKIRYYFINVEPYGVISGGLANKYYPGSSIVLPNINQIPSYYVDYYDINTLRNNSATTGSYTQMSIINQDVLFKSEFTPLKTWRLVNKTTNESKIIAQSREAYELVSYNFPENIDDGDYRIELYVSSEEINYFAPTGDNGELNRYSKIINFMRDPETKNLINYRAYWDFTIGDSTTSKSVEGITLWEACNKAISLIKPSRYQHGGFKPSKYKLDNKLYPILSTIQAPKFDFTGLKSLYDVLLELGRDFYGVPRLILNESRELVISFDIQDKTIKGNINFKEPDVLISRTSSDLANSANFFVSNLTNIVSNKRFIRYPSGDIWVKPRSISSNAILDRSSMGIILDKPIYEIKSVKVRNVFTNSPNTTFDISSYVYETSIFNTLEQNKEGQGTAIKYTQYDNKITGLGILSDSDELEKLLGLENGEYVINNILHKIQPGAVFGDSKEFEYKIEYYTVSDALVKTELSNQSNIKNQSCKVLNQDNALISDTNFGDGASIQLKRLGNETITANYRLQNPLELPEIGQRKVFNGDIYYADRVSITFQNNYFDVSVQYSKNYSSINPRVGVNSEYRLYRIYSNNYVFRDVNFDNYCYISTELYDPSLYVYAIRDKIFKSFEYDENNITKKEYPPESIYITPLDSGFNLLTSQDKYGSMIKRDSLLLNADLKLFDNSFLISAQMVDNYSAGRATIKDSLSISNTLLYKQKDVGYVDINGECPIMRLAIATPTPEQLKFPKFNNNFPGYDTSLSLPAVATINPSNLNDVCYQGYFKIDKDNREALRFNYQLHFITYDPKITIHNNLVKHLFKRYDDSNELAAKIYLVKKDYRDIHYVDPGDLRYDCGYIDVEKYGISAIKIKSKTITSDSDYSGFVIAYPNDNDAIILSFEDSISSGETYIIPDIYLNFSEDKIEYKNK